MSVPKGMFTLAWEYSIVHNIKSFWTDWARVKIYMETVWICIERFWSLPQYILRINWFLDEYYCKWSFFFFTKRTLTTLDKYLHAKTFCLIHPVWKASDLQMRGWGNDTCSVFKKMFLKLYCTHLSVTAELIHRKCSCTDLLQKKHSGKQLGKAYRSDMKVYFIYFIFSRWASSRTSACTSLRILEWFRW